MIVRAAGRASPGCAGVMSGSGGAGRVGDTGVGGTTPGINDGLATEAPGAGCEKAGAGRAPGQVGGRADHAAGPAAEPRSMVNSP